MSESHLQNYLLMTRKGNKLEHYSLACPYAWAIGGKAKSLLYGVRLEKLHRDKRSSLFCSFIIDNGNCKIDCLSESNLQNVLVNDEQSK